ncbi:outer membrane efflux protein [Emticicia oligotrophica DSM 17448]|uniref:Outer membrane efflux protein n=1 Tax=Emticicia oligotrophica (strain DSM 17448 / CIP 109782 / MTCC 6937 / GPTSA100-15) TaxID=929562 RepID=A0ABM5N2V7_EMTOG|nr:MULTISPECIES: TolC family protein [Emticicia]AFK03791.1 outer membrane efflux protein [Emticicia oligotrophica DSM 17448]
MKKTSLFIYMIWQISTLTANAQGNATQLSLKGCVDYALKNHLSNTIANNEILAAKEKEREALSGYLPQVNANIGFDDNLKRQVSVIPAGAFSPTEIRIQFGNQYNTNAAAQVDQVIYDKSMLLGLKAAEPNNQLAALKKEQTQENLIYNTANAYFQVLVYLEQEKLTLENEKKYRELVNILKLRLEKGVIKKTDLDRTQSTLNNILAQKSIIQANKEVSLNRLKNVIGMPLSEEISINESINYESFTQLIRENSLDVNNIIDYRVQSNSIALQEIDVKRKQAAFLPTVSAYGRYGAQSFGNDFGKSFTNWFDYSSVGLKVNVPIFSGYRKNSQLKQSEISLLNARTNLKLSTESMQLAFQNSASLLLKSQSDLKINKENLNFAKEVFESSTFEYQKGISTLSDLLNADYSYKEAQSNYMNSLINFLSTRLEYEKSKGNLKNYINQF